MTGVPTDDSLTDALSGLLQVQVRVTKRTPLGTGTFPKELVTLDSGQITAFDTLFVKYEAGVEHDDLGHRAGVDYEARVYEEILVPSGALSDVFVGALRPGTRRQTWLVLRYLADAQRAKSVARAEGMLAAAEFAGRLHRTFAQSHCYTRHDWLIRYDEPYLALWAQRARRLLPTALVATSSVDGFIEAFLEVGIPVLRRGQTLIHGEYYPKNVLWCDGSIVPVDWESSAVGPGEVDLAMLIDNWPRDVGERCIERYVSARWPDGAPDDFPARFFWACAHTSLRWFEEGATSGRLKSARLQELERMARAYQSACPSDVGLETFRGNLWP